MQDQMVKISGIYANWMIREEREVMIKGVISPEGKKKTPKKINYYSTWKWN